MPRGACGSCQSRGLVLIGWAQRSDLFPRNALHRATEACWRYQRASGEEGRRLWLRRRLRLGAVLARSKAGQCLLVHESKTGRTRRMSADRTRRHPAVEAPMAASEFARPVPGLLQAPLRGSRKSAGIVSRFRRWLQSAAGCVSKRKIRKAAAGLQILSILRRSYRFRGGMASSSTLEWPLLPGLTFFAGGGDRVARKHSGWTAGFVAFDIHPRRRLPNPGHPASCPEKKAACVDNSRVV